MPVKRCSICHLYIEGAPSPHLVHDGKFGPSCESRHHPDPCDYVGREHGPCVFYKPASSADSEGDSDHLSPEQLQSRDKNRQEEMSRMSAELVALKEKQEAVDNMAAEMTQMRQMIKMMRAPPPSNISLVDAELNLNINGCNISTQPTTTLTSSTSTVTSSMSVGGLGHDHPQLGVAGAGSLQPLHLDVSNHIQKNTVPPATVQSRGDYSGPTIADIRKDSELDAIALRVLAALENRIPQIKETFAHVTPNTSPSYTPVTTHCSTPLMSQTSAFTSVTASLANRPVSSTVQLQRPSSDLQHPAYAALAAGAAPGYQSDSAAHLSGLGAEEFLDAAAIMQLCTVSNRRQLRPHEFAKMGRFSYASKVTDKNITVPLFVMGYLQHVVALLKGVVPVQTDTEIVDRLSNLLTIMEITANNSTLDDFKCPGWSIGLEYAGRIFHDIEYGRVKWENLSEGLQAHTFLYAKDAVEMQQPKASRGGGNQQGGRGRGRGGGKGRSDARSDKTDDGRDGSNKICQSYNGFWTGSGCAYEYNNNRKCSFEHFCSKCHGNSGKKVNHKACYCSEQEATPSGAGGNSSTKPAVTTSG